MRTLFLVMILAGAYLQSCKSQNLNETVKITPLTVMNETDTFTDKERTSIDRIEYFLVEGNMSDTGTIYKVIDDFVKGNMGKNPAHFSVYYMEFYRASSRITVESVNRNPDIIRKSLLIGDPRIITYMWFNGHFGGVVKYQDGKI